MNTMPAIQVDADEQPGLSCAYEKLRLFFSRCGYGYAVSQYANGAVFANFVELQSRLKMASPFHKFVLSVFLQGHAAAERHVRRFIPPRVLEACLDTGLLRINDHCEYDTGGRVLTVSGGMLVIAPIPDGYDGSASLSNSAETANYGQNLVFHDVPKEVRGRRCLVLDDSPGSVLRAMQVAALGAKEVVAILPTPEDVERLEMNASLNDVSSFVRGHAELAELSIDEKFDYIVCRCYAAPELSNPSQRLAGLVDDLQARGAPGLVGRIETFAVGTERRVADNEELRALAESRGLELQAIVVDKRPFQASGGIYPWNHLFCQIVHFKPRAGAPEFATIPLYNAMNSDPLVSLVNRYQGTC